MRFFPYQGPWFKGFFPCLYSQKVSTWAPGPGSRGHSKKFTMPTFVKKWLFLYDFDRYRSLLCPPSEILCPVLTVSVSKRPPWRAASIHFFTNLLLSNQGPSRNFFTYGAVWNESVWEGYNRLFRRHLNRLPLFTTRHFFVRSWSFFIGMLWNILMPKTVQGRKMWAQIRALPIMHHF